MKIDWTDVLIIISFIVLITLFIWWLLGHSPTEIEMLSGTLFLLFKKIDAFVAEKNILPRDCLYHTWRNLKNSKKQETGKIRILVWKGDSVARTEYVCPECGRYGYQELEWKRPFSVKCQCGFRITVPKMRQEFKKEMKSGK